MNNNNKSKPASPIALFAAATIPMDGDFEKIKSTPPKPEGLRVPEEVRWAENMEKKHEKRVAVRERIQFKKDTFAALKDFKAKAIAKKEGKPAPAAAKPAETEAKPANNDDKFFQSAIIPGRSLVGLIDDKEFLLLINDLRSLVSQENEVVTKNPLTIKRIDSFLKKIDFSPEKFESLNRTQKSCLVLDAYRGFHPNVAPGLQLTVATDIACSNVNAKQKIDYVSRMKLIKASLGHMKGYVPGENDQDKKNVLNFAGRANNAIDTLHEIAVEVNDPAYVRKLETFQKAALAMISWIASESVLVYYKDMIENTGYKFITKDDQYFIGVCRVVGFNVMQACRILQAVEDTLLDSPESVHKFIQELLTLGKTKATIGDLFGDKLVNFAKFQLKK